ncbi:MAG: tetratricopeptide repeat protein [Endomicrobium sp.]|jgi:tetratricopeptide (TPR) repeat protein|nr:tetratricopeptide repeat protein [Endomicrobium sp.]
MLADGIEKYNFREWVLCIKRMEELENFASENKFPKAVKYYAKAKEYIGKAISELSKSVSYKKDAGIQSEGLQEKLEYNEITADREYTEGLILYAQGKYYEAERAWELTLRLNPNHQKARIALGKIKNSVSN